MASTVASIIFESCTFAALTRTARGMFYIDRLRSVMIALVILFPKKQNSATDKSRIYFPSASD
jgi:hypothetical protein